MKKIVKVQIAVSLLVLIATVFVACTPGAPTAAPTAAATVAPTTAPTSVATAKPRTPAPSPTVASVATKAPTQAPPEWQQKWDAAVAGAKKEGKLSLYGPVDGAGRDMLIKALKDKFGIDLEVLPGVEGQIIARILQERQAGLYNVDVTLLSATSYISSLKPQGAMTKLDQYLILPEVKDPKNWINGKFPMFDKDGTVVALTSTYEAYVLINTDIVKETDIRSFRDLLKPEFKGKIVMLDPTTGPGPTATMVNYFFPKLMGLQDGEKFLRDLVKQDLVFTSDSRQITEWVAKQKYPIGIGAYNATIGDFMTAGAHITRIRPTEGGVLVPGVALAGIVDKAPHPNAATVFLNWALTDEGQAVYSTARNGPPRRLGVKFTSGDQYGVVLPGDKTIEANEEFYLDGAKTANWATDIFKPAVGK